MGQLGTWANRIKLTIDNTKVDAAQSDFPVYLNISASSGISSFDLTAIFDELTSDANRKKIAVTTSDGTTQCYVEIERWSDANEKAELWVKVPSVSDSAETILYLYYDSSQPDNITYVGDTGDVAAQNVWDSNFKLVMHMADDTTSTIKDSTSNVNDGTKVAANRPIEIDGKIGKAQDFERNTSDYIDLPSYTLGTLFTIEFVIKPESIVTWEEVFGKNYHLSGCIINADGHFVSYIGNGTSWGNSASGPVGALVAGTTYYIQVTYDGVNLTSYKDLAQNATVANTMSVPATNLRLGLRGTQYHYDGLIDEVRISNIKRTVAWRKATYYSNWDELVSFEFEETETEFKDLKTEIAADPTTAFLDLLLDIQTSAQIFQDLKSSIEVTYATEFADLKTELFSKAQKLTDLYTQVKAGNLSITDLSSEIVTKAQRITDINTYIRAIDYNFKDLATAIEVIRCKHWLKTEIKAGCAARWYYTTEWNPNRSLKTSIEAKKPYEFSFSTITGTSYPMQEAEVELLIPGYSFPLRTLFLDYIKVGTVNEYTLQIWGARGLSGKNPFRDVKIKAEYIDTQYSGGFEVVTCDWISIKVDDGEYQTVNETSVNLGDIPCDSKLDVTLKVNCRDCSYTRGLAFFKLIITGDFSESVYGGPAVYRDEKLYHVGECDDYRSDDFICRLYVVQ